MNKSFNLKHFSKVTTIVVVLFFALVAVSVVFASSNDNESDTFYGMPATSTEKIQNKIEHERSDFKERRARLKIKLNTFVKLNNHNKRASSTKVNSNLNNKNAENSDIEIPNQKQDTQEITSTQTEESFNRISSVIPPNTSARRILRRIRINDRSNNEVDNNNSDNQSTSTGSSESKIVEPNATNEKPTMEKLQEVSETFRRIRQENNSVQKRIQKIYSKESEKVLKELSINMRNASIISGEDKKDSEAKRTYVLEKVRKHIKERGEDLRKKLDDTLTLRNAINPDKADTSVVVGRALSSSLDDIKELALKESGVAVGTTLSKRTVSTAASRVTTELVRERKSFDSRSGLSMYRDTDKDGISDYDEKNIYGTDPRNAFTSGSSLTDGERVLLGLNALSTSTKRVVVDSPLTSGKVVPGLFTVDSIVVKKRIEKVTTDLKTKNATTTKTKIALKEKVSGENNNKQNINNVSKYKEVQEITFTGSALPNSFVTLYIFSNPIIVTIKTDINGNWKYTLDQELDSGKHKMYVASVSNAGKIIAKSNMIPFVKTAEAVDFTPLAPEVFDTSTITDIKKYTFLGSGILALFLAFVGLVTIGTWKRMKN